MCWSGLCNAPDIVAAASELVSGTSSVLPVWTGAVSEVGTEADGSPGSVASVGMSAMIEDRLGQRNKR